MLAKLFPTAIKFKLIFLLGLMLKVQSAFAQVVSKETLQLMGSHFEITVVEKDTSAANLAIAAAIAEIARIENQISEWRQGTEISEVNRMAGIAPVRVSQEVFELTKRAVFFSKISNGAFDISTAAMDKVWKFDGSMEKLPDAHTIKNSVKNVDYRNIILDSANSTIFLKKIGMKIGFGATGKSYAADRARNLLKRMGVPGGIINASGDIAAWGSQPNGSPWSIGLQNPAKNRKVIRVIRANDLSIVTSGDYEKFVEFSGVRYSHIINPKTGWPAKGMVSVTVVGPSTEFANGLSTSAMVLGKKAGSSLIRKYPEYSAILIDEKGRISSVNRKEKEKLR